MVQTNTLLTLTPIHTIYSLLFVRPQFIHILWTSFKFSQCFGKGNSLKQKTKKRQLLKQMPHTYTVDRIATGIMKYIHASCGAFNFGTSHLFFGNKGPHRPSNLNVAANFCLELNSFRAAISKTCYLIC